MKPTCPHRGCHEPLAEAFTSADGEFLRCAAGHECRVNLDGSLRPICWEATPASNEPISAILITVAVVLLVGAFLIYTIFIAAPR